MDRIVYLHSFSDAEGNVTGTPFGGDWPLRIHSTLLFAGHGSRTNLTLRWSPIDATAEEEAAFAAAFADMTGGWSGTLDRLAEYLAEKRP